MCIRDSGYTYGVVSAMVNFEREGYFAVAAQVGADVTQEALREIYAEIARDVYKRQVSRPDAAPRPRNGRRARRPHRTISTCCARSY